MKAFLQHWAECNVRDPTQTQEEILRKFLKKEMGLWQCVYCVSGFNHVEDIRTHVAHQHPAEFPWATIRLSLQKSNQEVSFIVIVFSLIDFGNDISEGRNDHRGFV